GPERRCGGVEVNERASVDALVEGRKVPAPRLGAAGSGLGTRANRASFASHGDHAGRRRNTDGADEVATRHEVLHLSVHSLDDTVVSMSAYRGSSAQGPRTWLMLIHQLPPKPDYLRVKVRRRLHKLGAVLLKNSVYVLPESDGAMEDLQW